MSGDSKKSDITREKILQAATQVFAEHPYKAASIRMIGKAGGFDHPLIHYYYPTKAKLFEAVVVQICDEFKKANDACFVGLESLSPKMGLPLYVERFINFHKECPEPLSIIVKNMPQLDNLDEIPGYQHIPELLGKFKSTFKEKINPHAPEEQIDMFINSLNTLVISYLGSSPCLAEVIGMDPKSEEYYDWVQKTLVFVMLPVLERIIYYDRKSN